MCEHRAYGCDCSSLSSVAVDHKPAAGGACLRAALLLPRTAHLPAAPGSRQCQSLSQHMPRRLDVMSLCVLDCSEWWHSGTLQASIWNRGSGSACLTSQCKAGDAATGCGFPCRACSLIRVGSTHDRCQQWRGDTDVLLCRHARVQPPACVAAPKCIAIEKLLVPLHIITPDDNEVI